MKHILNLLVLVVMAFNINAQEVDFAFTNVNVISMENDQVILNQTVLIRGGKILAIGKSQDISVAETVTVVDGTGKFLMPGIAEMHAHIPSNRNGTELVEETLFLYLSNGITLIRGMLGEPYHLELKKQVLNDEVLGPRIYTSGPSINGNSVRSVAEAKSKVRAQKAAGYDFLKMHPGLTLENFNAVVTTANEVGIPFAGHVSIDVGVRRAIEAKYASIDHVDGYIEGLVSGVDPNTNGFFGLDFTDKVDQRLIPELVNSTKENNVWIVPTQVLMEQWAGPKSAEELGALPEMQYMNKRTVNSWINTKKGVLNDPNYSAEKGDKFNQIRRNIMKSMHDAGVGFLLGSDAPQVFNVPGFSIQREMQSMSKAGFSNYEILKSGTVNPAIYFGDQNDYGKIKEGLSADLILLDANPLTDIKNMQNQSGVMVRGRWLSAEFIKTKLEAISRKYAN
jgi:imidazolonepropionase-like amidohydrolase